jgi:hypothetical protein
LKWRYRNARRHGALEVMEVTPDERVERYRWAWETADADEVVNLFTPDAAYRSSVFREPYLGSEATRQYWQRGACTKALRAQTSSLTVCRRQRMALSKQDHVHQSTVAAGSMGPADLRLVGQPSGM